MLDFFGNIKNYALIALGVLVSGLLVSLKLKSAKNDKLKSDIKLEKKNVIETIRALDYNHKLMELNNEAKRINEDIRRSNSDTNRTRLRKYSKNNDSKSANV